MPHPLEIEYALTTDELLDAINRRFRAKVTLEGAVAEVHLERRFRFSKIMALLSALRHTTPMDTRTILFGFPDSQTDS